MLMSCRTCCKPQWVMRRSLPDLLSQSASWFVPGSVDACSTWQYCSAGSQLRLVNFNCLFPVEVARAAAAFTHNEKRYVWKRASSLSMNIELEAIYFLKIPPLPAFFLSLSLSPPSWLPSLASLLLSHSTLMRLLDNDPCTLFLIRHTQ